MIKQIKITIKYIESAYTKRRIIIIGILLLQVRWRWHCYSYPYSDKIYTRSLLITQLFREKINSHILMTCLRFWTHQINIYCLVELSFLLMNNYIVKSYRDVIVITKFAITKYAIRRASKAQSWKYAYWPIINIL